MKYAVCNSENVVVNVILWDGKSQWTPPAGCYVIESNAACIGDWYNKEDKTFVKPIIIDEENEELL